MRKVIIFLSILSGILYGLKTGFYFQDYDGAIVVAFIVCTPLIISVIIADVITYLKKGERLMVLPKLVTNTALAIAIVFVSMYATHQISEFIYNKEMMSSSEEIINRLNDYQERNSELPENLAGLKVNRPEKLIYLVKEDKKNFKLGYVCSKNIYDLSKVTYHIYENRTNEWITTDKSSKLGF